VGKLIYKNGVEIDWHKKPPERVRSVADALEDAERLRKELPVIVQVRAMDWDKVILADEIERLKEQIDDMGYERAELMDRD